MYKNKDIEHALSLLNIVPLRAEASEKSEMVSQILFGEICTIIEYHNGWLKVECHYDKYIGWCDSKMVKIINNNQYESLKKLQSNHFKSQISTIKKNNNPFTVSLGAIDITDFYELKNYNINIKDSVSTKQLNISESGILEIAQGYLGTPYLWGGRSFFGIDCSGFTQMIFRFKDIHIPRDASLQAECGETINFITDAKIGDLLFFDNSEGKITHVGIYIDKGKIIHSSGEVRIDNVDQNGIFNNDEKKYSHNLRIIKRFIN